MGSRFLILFLLLANCLLSRDVSGQRRIESFIVEKPGDISLYWKKPDGTKLLTIFALKEYLKEQKKDLVFAMNAGMFDERMTPVGLYIENGKQLKPVNLAKSGGNFALKPNGIFYISNSGKAVVCTTEQFPGSVNIRYATQSGPMLLIDGSVHPKFTAGSKNLNIRNGVGILPDGKILFAISIDPVSFYDFAMFFKSKGFKNALYLDGAISEMYSPEKNMLSGYQLFGVMIGVSKPAATR